MVSPKSSIQGKRAVLGAILVGLAASGSHAFAPSSQTSVRFEARQSMTTTAWTPRSSGAALGGPLSLSTLTTSSHHHEPSRRRKRDIIRKALGSTSSRLNPHHSTSSTVLLARKKDSGEDTADSLSPRLEQLKADIMAKIPPKLLELVETVMEKAGQLLPTVRTVLLSFVAGIVLTITAILVPVYNQVENLAEPVTLFETILGDLDQRYVDQVDTQKLFETGVSAMLRSLDPYTEFEGKQQAQELNESIGGKYGGVGLVISGATPKDLAMLESSSSSSSSSPSESTEGGSSNPFLPDSAKEESRLLREGEDITSSDTSPPTNSLALDNEEDDDDDTLTLQDRIDQRRAMERAKDRGIRVVSAFEGYAFDYGMRVGDKLLAIDGNEISPATSVEQVRNYLRGEPGTEVTISFEREGVDGRQSVTMPRTVVKIRDVKLAAFLGDPKDGIGYIQLTGFASDAGREVRNSILALQRAAEDASNGDSSLQGLVLDLRGNPGGLLTSAVDVASLLVPKGSDIVSAKGRGFPGVLYRSRVDPILDQKTKLAVLVNEGTASAAEIVSGAVQDLDVGVIVGSGRTFGKGLVQNVEDLPFDTALKYTVAKYYTPSGRCIQGINYSGGGGLNSEDGGRYKASKVAKKDRSTFYTRLGREVKDGGGVEADFKVDAPKASALEVTLLRSGVFSDFAAKWSREHQLTKNFDIDNDTYREFQAFVNQKQKEGDIKLEGLYTSAINDLKKSLKASGYKGSGRELDQLQTSIVREVQKDFEKYRSDIKEDLQQSILARYLPESMLIERSIKSDVQVNAAAKLLSNGRRFNSLLAKGSSVEQKKTETALGSISTASSSAADKPTSAVKLNMKW